MATKWPKEVTVVEPRDMCTRAYTNPRGQHCAAGCALTELGEWGLRTSQWEAACRKIAVELGVTGNKDETVEVINDRLCCNNAERAALVNLTWKALGYDVPASACKWPRKSNGPRARK